MDFGQECHKGDTVSFSVPYIRKYVILTCLIMSDVNFDHLVKAMLTHFNCKVTNFAFEIKLQVKKKDYFKVL